MTAVLATAVFAVTYALIATEHVHRVAAALGGAAGMVLIGVVDADSAFHDPETAIDWNVIFLLLGMMLLVGVIRQTGLFEYLAIWAAKRARGRPFRLMASLVVITATASALLDNVTTVLLVAPVTVLVCRRLDLDPVPFLIAEVLASNIGGTATLIGDPPNIIIASRAGLSFNDFLVHLAPIALVLLAVLLGLCRLLFRSALAVHPDRVAEIMALDERAAITDRRLLRESLAVLGLTIAGFVLHTTLHCEPKRDLTADSPGSDTPAPPLAERTHRPRRARDARPCRAARGRATLPPSDANLPAPHPIRSHWLAAEG